MAISLCDKCQSPLAKDGVCLKCLLDSGITGMAQSLSERIFQASLAFPAEERRLFIAEAAQGDESVVEEALMLLDGYAEAGGDTAEATMGGTARERWAAVRREEPGTVIDHFRLVKIVGEGGMGSVWEAEQTQPIQRRVALKIIKLGMDTEEVVRRFERERRTLALMTHANIAQVYEAGATPAGRPYFAMELVEGRAITTHCLEFDLGLTERLHLFTEVCAAVEHAHQKGVIHRDLKPSNILVAEGRVKVIDFGVAKAMLDELPEALLTRQAQVLGTPAYMSPEQAESEGIDVDTRTDVYSLGVVLYELLSGTLPFDPKRLASTHLREVQRIIKEELPPKPSTRIGPSIERFNPAVRPFELTGDLDWIAMKALSKERDRRYASAANFAEDIKRFLNGEAVYAVPPTIAYRCQKFVSRNKGSVAAAVAILATLIAGIVVSAWQVHRTHQALAGEANARAEVTFSLADLYAQIGLSESEKGDPTRAALWFTRAAQIAVQDPARYEANRLRSATWTNSSSVPVAAFETGLPHIDFIEFHPHSTAVIVHEIFGGSSQVWDLTNDQPWKFADKAKGASWSPDGASIALSVPGRVQILEYPSGKVIAEQPGDGLAEVAFNPAGDILAIGPSPSRLWHWKTGEVIPAAPRSEVRRIRWSPDGKFILWQQHRELKITSVETPQSLLYPSLPSNDRSLADFTADGKAFFHSEEGKSYVRLTATGELLHEVANGGYSVAISPDGSTLARSKAPLWDASDRQRQAPRHRAGNMMESASFSPDGRFLATASYDATVRLWDCAADSQVNQVGWHQHPVQCVQWNREGTFLASSQIGLVRIWKVQQPPPLTKLPLESDSLVTLSDDGKWIAPSGLTNRTNQTHSTQVFECATGQPVGPEIKTAGILTTASFFPSKTAPAERSTLFLGVSTTPQRESFDWKSGGSGHMVIVDWKTGQHLEQPITLPSEPRSIAVHPSGDYVAIYCGGGEGLEWDAKAKTLRPLFASGKASIPQHTFNNGRIVYSAKGDRIAACGQLGVNYLYDREQQRALPLPAIQQDDAIMHGIALSDEAVCFTPIGPSSPLVSILELHNGNELVPPLRHSDWIYHATFDQTGNSLLTTGRYRIAQVWDWRKSLLLGPAMVHENEVMAGVFIPGTPWIATGAHDGYVRFWDRRTGMLIRPPLFLSGLVLELQLTPDGHFLIAAGLFSKPSFFKIDLRKALPPLPASTDPTQDLLQAEINAAATVHDGGGLVPLTSEAWLQKWQAYRKSWSIK